MRVYSEGLPTMGFNQSSLGFSNRMDYKVWEARVFRESL